MGFLQPVEAIQLQGQFVESILGQLIAARRFGRFEVIEIEAGLLVIFIIIRDLLSLIADAADELQQLIDFFLLCAFKSLKLCHHVRRQQSGQRQSGFQRS